MPRKRIRSRRRRRQQRLAAMDKESLDVQGATLLGISTRTIYTLARNGTLLATRVGREWRFARQKLIQWVGTGSEVEQLATALRKDDGAEKQLTWPATGGRGVDLLSDVQREAPNRDHPQDVVSCR